MIIFIKDSITKSVVMAALYVGVLTNGCPPLPQSAPSNTAVKIEGKDV